MKNKKMQKYGLIALMIIVAAFSVFLPLYIWPREVWNEFDAVMFTEGKTSEYIEVSIDIDGHMNRRLFGGSRFAGKIKLEGSGLPEEYYTQNISIRLDANGIGILRYLDEGGEEIKLVQKGYVSMPMDVSYILISWGDAEDIGNHDVRGSTVIAGPFEDEASAESFFISKFAKFMD